MRAAQIIIAEIGFGDDALTERFAALIDERTAAPEFCRCAAEYESWEKVHGSTLPSPACLQTVKGQFGDALIAARRRVETP